MQDIDFETVDNIIEEKGIKKGNFYNSTGISRQNYANFKAQGYIPAKHAKKISDFLGVNIDFIYGLTTQKEQTTIQLKENYEELPIVYAGAGAEAFAVDTAERRSIPIELIPPQIALDENLLLMVVVGNSMEPLYYENDIVFIDMVNGRDFLHVNGTYLVRYGDTVQIKDVEFLGNGEILLFSRNSNAIINPSEHGVEWEIVGKPYANLHPVVGSKLQIK